jgi:hypothetical protein
VQTAPSHSADPAAQRGGDPRRLLALGAALLASALVIALASALDGCGSSGASGSEADPATLTPASAPLYAGASVRPTGALATAALTATRELTRRADPYARLVALLQTPGSHTLNYRRDVAPWLGERAGIFTTSVSGSGSAEQSLLDLVLPGSSKPSSAFPFGPGGAQGAIVLDTKDASKAQAFIDAQAADAGAHAGTYRGVAVETSATGVAFAMVRRVAVLGSEAGVHDVIDTSLGSAALASASGYTQLAAAAPPGALAHLYSNATAAQAAAHGAPGLAQLLAGAREANVSLIPSAGSLGIDADSSAAPASGGGLLAAGVNGSQAFGELPGGSWLALGVGDAGASLSEDVAGLRALLGLATGATGEGQNTPGLSLKGIAEGLLTPLGILGGSSPQARSAFSSWMGSGGIFAAGPSLFELRGAVVINSKDPAASRAAVAKLGTALHAAGESVTPATIAGTEAALGVRVNGLPLMLDIADGRDSQGAAKFVLGLGEASVQEALHPQSTLAGASSTAASAAALGSSIKPNLSANVPTIISLLESVGLTNGLSGVLPYLRNVSTVSGGASSLGGGLERVRIVVGLRQTEG